MESMPRAIGILVAVLTLAVGVAPATAQLVAPANTVLPSISGTAVDMQTLTSSRGSWSGSDPITYERQWLRCEDATTESCFEIFEATGSTYEVTSDDIGWRIRVLVVARNAVGSATAVSSPTAVVTGLPPTNINPPQVSGTTSEGEVLVASTGLWAGSPRIAFTYVWMRCDAAGTACGAIDGATGRTHTLTGADAGHTLRVVVTASNSGGSASAQSGPSAVVMGYPPSNLAPPTVTGTAQQGQLLVGAAGEWTGDPAFSYQWLRCTDLDFATCAEIPDATGIDYGVVAEDVGGHLRLQVTATNSSGTAGMASAATDAVVAASVDPDPEPEPEPDGRATGLANAAGHARGVPALLSVFTGDECDQQCLVSLLVGFVTGSDRGKPR
jgi:hypothetical protein